MIKTFRHKGLRRLFETGQSSQVRPDLRQRCLRRLDALDQAASLAQLNIPGYRLHRLSGHKPPRYAIDVNGPWLARIRNEDARGDCSLLAMSTLVARLRLLAVDTFCDGRLVLSRPWLALARPAPRFTTTVVTTTVFAPARRRITLRPAPGTRSLMTNAG